MILHAPGKESRGNVLLVCLSLTDLCLHLKVFPRGFSPHLTNNHPQVSASVSFIQCLTLTLCTYTLGMTPLLLNWLKIHIPLLNQTSQKLKYYAHQGKLLTCHTPVPSSDCTLCSLKNSRCICTPI